jgi:hypothetical protein
VVKNRAAYQRRYNKAWKQARRTRLIEMLGGRCVRCGATEDLEFDHIDPSTKVFAVCAGLSKAWDVLVEEALKCQLLCRPCHVAKGAEDRPEPTHGTYYVYWYYGCRCESCKAANARKSAALRAKRLEKDAVNGEFSVTEARNDDGPGCVSAAQSPLSLPRQDSNLEPAG